MQSKEDPLQTYAAKLTTIFCKRFNVRRNSYEDLDSQALLYLMETLEKVQYDSTKKTFIYRSVLGMMLNYIKKQHRLQKQEKYLLDTSNNNEINTWYSSSRYKQFNWYDLCKDHYTVLDLLYRLSGHNPVTNEYTPCQLKKAARELLKNEHHWTHARIRKTFNELKEEYGK